MLRNKEYRLMLVTMFAVLSIGAVTGYFISPAAGAVVILCGLLLTGISALYTIRRYKEIEKLSIYLRRIYSGDYSLDLRDNMEGELSILKSDIYKVTLILSKQAELLKSEKEQLANAISDISHQLKTPLTSMMVMTDLLNKDNLTLDKRQEFTKNLEHQLERMEWLLTSLLKLSKLDAKTVKFKSEPVVVQELIQLAMKPLMIPMELKEQRLIIQGVSKVSFLGDLGWTAEALINIIKNCIEHTQRGGEIKVSFSKNPIYTEILICDNGSGIDKEELPYIFKRFFKGKNAAAESVGIGLAMAKSIITGQNGDVSVTSKKQQGTNFCIRFYNRQEGY
jgi:signal transduction histidine kinase